MKKNRGRGADLVWKAKDGLPEGVMLEPRLSEKKGHVQIWGRTEYPRKREQHCKALKQESKPLSRSKRKPSGW